MTPPRWLLWVAAIGAVTIAWAGMMAGIAYLELMVARREHGALLARERAALEMNEALGSGGAA